MTGSARIRALDAVPLYPVSFHKSVVLRGYADFRAPIADLMSVELIGSSGSDILVLKLQLQLQSDASVAFLSLGRLNLTALLNGTTLGYAISDQPVVPMQALFSSRLSAAA